ncbi:baseplate wedge subunit [Ochrobactrum phage vB_OspM_OC]|nr:baseplate wedge subunit [Ochrobactrum phage vB_OspM_OC]
MSQDFIKPIQQTIYSDLDMAFQAHPISGKLKQKTNVDAIKQAIKNTVLYNKYEMPFEPNLYGGVKEMLFENIEGDSVVQTALKVRIENIIKIYEPRAVLNDLLVSVDSDRHSIKLEIYFTPINKQEPTKIDIFLERVR